MPDDVLTPVRAMLARACEFEGQGPRFGVLLQEALPAVEALDSEALGEMAPLLRHVNGRFALEALWGLRAPVRNRALRKQLDDPEPDRQMII